jgi:5-methylcytosine-specific restriction endonuclease McrA
MTRYRRIVFTAVDNDLLNEVRACTGEWSTTLDPIIRLRARLKDLQNLRCVYCQAPIEAEELGYRELEHILPKGKSSRCTVKSGTSNDPQRRRATLGYPEFKFEPLNLAVSCSQCNNLKGMYDGLADRAQKRPLQAYPQAQDLIWFHPQYESYDLHINIDDDFGFTGLTDGGRAVVSACGLDRAEILENKFYARAYCRARHADSVRMKIDALASGVESFNFSKAQAARSLSNTCSIALADATRLLKRRLSARSAIEIESFYEECTQYEKVTE